MGMELHFKKGIKGIGAHTASGKFFVDGGVGGKSNQNSKMTQITPNPLKIWWKIMFFEVVKSVSIFWTIPACLYHHAWYTREMFYFFVCFS